ncbi:MAG: dipeptide ABC transporter ATP-binding protein [Proteobacteria bacterium]|nr:dipeptide ABC transporter ATP-binding protein [Pseudomonadota bacterium]
MTDNTKTSAADGPLVAVNGLQVAFGKNVAVDGVSLTIGHGETVALVGESGSGKSVTAMSILKLLPKAANISAGSVVMEGRNLLDLDNAALRSVRGRKVSVIFQEPMTSLNPVHTIQRQLVEMLLQHNTGMSKREARAQTLELLEQVGIQNAHERVGAYPHELSGGQRQRVMIAMALACNPEMIIADEPTTALDVTVQAQILTLLKDLQKKRGMALLLITHDLGVVRHMAERVYVMQHGKIVEEGKTEDIFTKAQHPYTLSLLNAEPKGTALAGDPNAPTVLKADNVKVWFPIKKGFLRKTVGHVKAVDGLSLDIKSGQTVGVVGESGSGKSTLGNMLLRLIDKSCCHGTVLFGDVDVQKLSGADLCRLRTDIQIVFQDPFGSLSPRMSVAEIVAEGLELHEPNLTAAEVDTKVCAVLNEVGLDPEMRHRYPHEFSGGQRQRISIARALILEPKFLVLDEPTSALDMTVQEQVVNLLRDIQKRRNLAYLFISHDLKVIRALSNHILVMKDGKVVEQGTAQEIFQQPKEAYTKALIAAAFNNKAVGGGVVKD